MIRHFSIKGHSSFFPSFFCNNEIVVKISEKLNWKTECFLWLVSYKQNILCLTKLHTWIPCKTGFFKIKHLKWDSLFESGIPFLLFNLREIPRWVHSFFRKWFTTERVDLYLSRKRKQPTFSFVKPQGLRRHLLKKDILFFLLFHRTKKTPSHPPRIFSKIIVLIIFFQDVLKAPLHERIMKENNNCFRMNLLFL